MKKTVFLYGVLLAALVIFLKALEYRFWVRDLSIETYIGITAVFFTALGIWFGLTLIKRQKPVQDDLGGAAIDSRKLKSHGITERELEVLKLMAGGLSNQEIANKLFVSLPTVKTHTANLYGKLNVRRRTQAVHKAREISLSQ